MALPPTLAVTRGTCWRAPAPLPSGHPFTLTLARPRQRLRFRRADREPIRC